MQVLAIMVYVKFLFCFVLFMVPLVPLKEQRVYNKQPRRYNKKLSCPPRKCASNVAILYGADGISIRHRIGMDHECDRQTAYVGAICQINTKRQVRHAAKVT